MHITVLSHIHMKLITNIQTSKYSSYHIYTHIHTNTYIRDKKKKKNVLSLQGRGNTMTIIALPSLYIQREHVKHMFYNCLTNN